MNTAVRIDRLCECNRTPCRGVDIRYRYPEPGGIYGGLTTTITVMFTREPVRICNVTVFKPNGAEYQIVSTAYNSATHVLTIEVEPDLSPGRQTIVIDVNCRTRCRKHFRWSWTVA